MINKFLLTISAAVLFSSSTVKEKSVGQTQICKWQQDKAGAVSLTFDDAAVTQFRVAIPILNRLALPGTFYIMTGHIPGSQYRGKFIGRPVQEIINETATIPTNEDNFFERASAAAFLGFKGTLPYHSKAGSLYESKKTTEAYKLMDELYEKVRKKELQPGQDIGPEARDAQGVGWEDFKQYAAQGHEIASHTITHPRLAVLDEANMLYEMEKSKEEIRNHLGEKHTFSFEGPYGTENERVMQYAYKIYPASRNRMPEPFLEELNRGNKQNPGASKKEYVQWQRGPLSKTPLELMKSWVDTVVAHDNTWLVLVFHGVDDKGWEPLPHELLEEYFQYMKNKEDKLWIATFTDVTKYIRERMNATAEASAGKGKILVRLNHRLDKNLYDLPLTLKTYVSPAWKKVKVTQGGKASQISTSTDGKGTFVLYQAQPNAQAVELTKAG
jgi:peptidoglycan/xylan/chitin deacetylase (PgdA/CDA1 family)